MQFLNPGYLYLALLGIIPVLLYFFRRKSKTVPVSTLVFFKTLAREHQESAWLRRMKKLLSLLLTLAVLCGAAAALSRIVFSPRAGELRSVVVLLDRSASMAAAGEGGTSRLEVAKEEIRTRLAGLPEDVGVSLLVYDSRPELALPKTIKRRQLLATLERVETRPMAGNADAALTMGRMVAALDPPAELWHYTDRVAEPLTTGAADEVSAPEGEGPGDGAGDPGENTAVAETPTATPPTDEEGEVEVEVEGARLRHFSVALNDPVNVGITAFQLRKVPLVHASYEAYLQVAAARSMEKNASVEMEVTLGGVPVQIRTLDLAPGDRQGLILPVEGVAGQLLRIRLKSEGDCFAADDEVMALLPESRPIVAAWISEDGDPFTELALTSIAREGELEFWKGSPESWPPKEEVDMVIFDGWLPEEWPTHLPAIVLNPPGSSGPVHAARLKEGGLPHHEVRVANEQHPLLFRVNSGRVALTQTAVLDVSGSLEPLWFAGKEPILSAGEVRGQRLVIMAFSPERSERLPLMASFPLLMGNAVYWCADPQLARAGSQQMKTGEVIEVGEGPLVWTEIRDGKVAESMIPIKAALVELDRIGLWTAGDGGASGSSLLLSREETDLSGPAPGKSAAGSAQARKEAGGGGVLKGEITWLILWGILLLLTVESWLFHRHAVY